MIARRAGLSLTAPRPPATPETAQKTVININKDAHNLSAPPDLQSSESRYRRLFECARSGIVILDAEQRQIIDVNPFMVRLVGGARDELLGKELRQIGLLEDRAASNGVFKELREKKFIHLAQLPLKTRSGDQRQVEMFGCVYEENGRQLIQCTVYDVTEREITEESLSRAETKYRNLVELLPAIVYLAEPNPPSKYRTKVG